MIVTLIEKVYNFLWGDLITLPLPGGGSVGLSLLVTSADPHGNLLYDPHPGAADPAVSRYDAAP